MIILFFIVLGIDTLCFFFFGYSTVLVWLTSLPILIIPGVFFLVLSLYLISKSHKAVFSDKTAKPKLFNSGVYSLVRHPMYLGILLFCLSFFFFSPSALSLVIWISFFIIYEKMTVYEEKDLIRMLGEEYIVYKNQVSKWFPGIRTHSKH